MQLLTRVQPECNLRCSHVPGGWPDTSHQEATTMSDTKPSTGIEPGPSESTTLPVTRPNKTTARIPLLLRLLRLVFLAGGYIAPGLAGRLACRLWYQTTRFPLPTYEKKILRDADVRREEFNGTEIASYAWGNSGSPVLFVHGWNGRGTQLASFVRPLTNAGLRLLAFDAPAHGQSPGGRTSIYEIADVIVELNRRYGPFPAIITHSFGGPAVALAMQQDLSTERIVCLCPPANADGLVDKFARTLQISDNSIRVMKRLIEKRFGETVWSEVSMQNNVKHLKVPAMIIHDEDDSDVPWQEGYAVSRAWPDCQFIKTSGLGHHRILRDKSTIKTVIDFIA